MTSTRTPAPDGPLSPEQVRRFQDAGYLVLPGLFAPEEMRRIRSWVDEAQSWPEEPGSAWMYFEQSEHGRRQLERMEKVLAFHPELRAMALGSRIRGACSQLFEGPALLFKDKINFKLPGGGGFEPHQDVQAGWARYGGLHITALVSVDPTTRANGCLEVASGFGGRGLIGQEWAPLSEDDLREMPFVHLEAEPGDAVFFDSFVPHRSGPNRTDQPRRVIYVTFGRASDGDRMEQYYADKFESYPPDVERQAGRTYRYKV